MPLSADSYKSSVKDSCRSIIRSGGKLRNYKDNEAPRINRTMTEKANQYTSSVKGRTSQSADIVAREVTRFRTEFHSHYKDMPSLEPKIDYAPSMTSISSTSIDLSVSNSLNNEVFLGRWATNIRNFFRSEQTIQDEVIAEVNTAIDRHFLGLESSVRHSVEAIKEKQKRFKARYNIDIVMLLLYILINTDVQMLIGIVSVVMCYRVLAELMKKEKIQKRSISK